VTIRTYISLDSLHQGALLAPSKAERLRDENSGNQIPEMASEFVVFNSLPEQMAGEIATTGETWELRPSRCKRHHTRQQKRLERLRKIALIAFLYMFTIVVGHLV
jgi:hypothetical protein